MKNNIITHLLNLLGNKGSIIQYGNENVTQLEHALQCAELAEKNNFSNEIITAALLHDIGHLLYDGEDPIHEGKDGYHENLGADYLIIGSFAVTNSEEVKNLANNYQNKIYQIFFIKIFISI